MGCDLARFYGRLSHVSGHAAAEPAEAGGETDDPQRPRHRDAHAHLQHQEGENKRFMHVCFRGLQ